MNNYKSLPNSAYSAPDHHSLQNHPHKTLSKYHVIIGFLLHFVNVTLCNRVQSIFNNITRHAIAVLGDKQGKTKRAGDPAHDRNYLPLSQHLPTLKRDLITFPANFHFPNPVFSSGERFSWLYICIGLRLIKFNFKISQLEKSLGFK